MNWNIFKKARRTAKLGSWFIDFKLYKNFKSNSVCDWV